MKNIKILILALFFGLPFWIFGQDIIQKTDNSTVACRVVEITETAVLYKPWDFQTGPNRSISQTSIVKIIYENGQVEFFGGNEPASAPVHSPKQDQPSASSSPDRISEQKSTASSGSEPPKLEYAPNRLTVGFNSLGYSSFGVDIEWRIISDYVNIGVGYWAHTFSYYEDYTYGSVPVYSSVFVPVNKLVGKANKINRGFFPFFQPGVDMVLQFPDEGGTQFSAGFIWRVGTDFYITDKFGISYSYSTGNLNNFGISFRW